MDTILKVENLKTSFFTHLGEIQAVRSVDFDVRKGEVLGIVGESGSGKSVTVKSIMSLLQYPGKVVDGQIIYKGMNLVELAESKMRKIRGNEISMIFQDPMTSLNPVMKIGSQIVDIIISHEKISRKKAKERALELLRKVKISSPEDRMNNYLHEFSGGMRQRVMIAIALACNPELLIADEPTTALDVTIQSQIMKLMKELQEELGTSIILITHDLGVVAETCNRVIVMYSGMIMEEADILNLFNNPLHPYTIGLINSIPRLDIKENEKLKPIKGTPPNLLNPPKGCPFAPRCQYSMKICRASLPQLNEVKPNHKTRCWLTHESAPENDIKKRLGE